MTTILIVAMWLVGVILTYGLMFAYLQGRFYLIAEEGYKVDAIFSLIVSLFAPFSSIAWLLFIGFIKLRDGEQVYYGFKFK